MLRVAVVVFSSFGVASSLAIAACSGASSAVDAPHDAWRLFPDVAPDSFVLDSPVFADSTAVDASVDQTVEADAAALTYPQVVRADTPLSYWRFGEASGTVATDETGTTNGTYTGAVTLGAAGAIAGDANTAASFDGTTGYVALGNGFDFAGTSAMSIEVWVKPGTLDTSSYRRLLSKEIQDGNGRQGYLIAAIAASDAGSFSFERFRDNGTEALRTLLPIGAYSHVVATYDGTTMLLYVNGAQVGNATSARTLATITVPLNLGTYSNPSFDPRNFFPGAIDELAIYDRALPAARVREHFRVGSGM